MDNDSDWVFVENDDELVVVLNSTSICEQTDGENLDVKNKSSYASILLKNIQENNSHQQSNSSIVQRKEKSRAKRDDKEESMASYVETKPGSQFRNPRDKAGTNKVHRRRQRSSEPPKKIGNSLKVGCSFCSPEVSNRAERRRTSRQQRSIVNWKDDDY
jgi:hypothetical protein